MTRSHSVRRFSQFVGACATPVLVAVAVGGGAAIADEVNRAPRIVVPQRIRPDAVGTLAPAALSGDGRLIAYVALNRDSLERVCCLNVYVSRHVNRADYPGKYRPRRHAATRREPGAQYQLGWPGHRVRDDRIEPGSGPRGIHTAPRHRSGSPARYPAGTCRRAGRRTRRRDQRAHGEWQRAGCRLHVRRDEPRTGGRRERAADRHLPVASRSRDDHPDQCRQPQPAIIQRRQPLAKRQS